MSAGVVGKTVRWWDSPFDWMSYDYENRRPLRQGYRWRLYQIGFHRKIEYECIEGYDIGTAHLPGWAKSPSAGIVGTWQARRKRLYWHLLPIWRWKAVLAHDTERTEG